MQYLEGPWLVHVEDELEAEGPTHPSQDRAHPVHPGDGDGDMVARGSGVKRMMRTGLDLGKFPILQVLHKVAFHQVKVSLIAKYFQIYLSLLIFMFFQTTLKYEITQYIFLE